MKIIGIFKTTCPSGWTRMSSWDGKFLMGHSAYGNLGGSSNHNHTINFSSKKTSGGTTYSDMDTSNTTVQSGIAYNHTHTISPPQILAEDADLLPPYLDVIFCWKEDN
jgi:hypothetical protein